MRKPKVAFICVHNACRSQIAQALGTHLAADVFESYSAGTQVQAQLNQAAVARMKELYGIDMQQTQRSKLLCDIPAVEVVVTMGCKVQCPFSPCNHREDWGIDDPSGKGDALLSQTIQEIERKILDLKQRLEHGLIETQS